jgi:2-polyprenyl-6-methoxyphenol hydroxylase-like FAD-dependent oxidoreductase
MCSPSDHALPEETTCAIVGGGPAGMLLGLLLARQRVDVTVLESHADFERDFRGDTLHASAMEIMSQLGLADEVLKRCRARIPEFELHSQGEVVRLASLNELRTEFPFIAMVPQVDFLNLLAAEAGKYECFHLFMNTRVTGLIREDGGTRGVLCKTSEGEMELRAKLTVGADGRGSRVRKAAGIELKQKAAPMDVLWFRLPRTDADHLGTGFYVSCGHLLVVLDRGDYWQIAYTLMKGNLKEMRDAGVEALREELKSVLPATIHPTIEQLKEWSQVSSLSVASGRVEKWFEEGLLLIGDAAHVMTPVGGVGINYAIQDAVAASNFLAPSLKAGKVSIDDLAKVQKRREWPTRFIQRLQTFIQDQIVSNALRGDSPFRLNLPTRLFLRIPWLRKLPAFLISYGIRRELLRD